MLVSGRVQVPHVVVGADFNAESPSGVHLIRRGFKHPTCFC